jgi:TetR/AcrR family transcriptional repressor of nem operon
VGRLKSYDRHDVARKAMQSFWKNGFHASSTKQLASDMGVNVYSLFAEFESKQGLFEAALDVYGRDVVTAIFADLDKPGAGLKELKEVIALQSSAALCPDVAWGCFYCNTATERGAEDKASREFFGAHIIRVQKIVQRALQNAQDAGKLRPEVSCRDQSSMLITTFQGLSVLVRAHVDPETIIATARALQENVRRLEA